MLYHSYLLIACVASNGYEAPVCKWNSGSGIAADRLGITEQLNNQTK